MLPDRVSNPGPLTYESGALPIALRGPAVRVYFEISMFEIFGADCEELPLFRMLLGLMTMGLRRRSIIRLFSDSASFCVLMKVFVSMV